MIDASPSTSRSELTEQVLSSLSSAQEEHDNGSESGSGGAAPGSLPCLLLSSQPNLHRIPISNRSSLARKSEALYQNLDAMIGRVGIVNCGFFTATFSENICCRKEAQRRWNSFNTHVLSSLFLESITVPERQARGAIHYHSVVNTGADIRTGFDFEACRSASEIKRARYRNGRWDAGFQAEFKRLERGYFLSANDNLRRIWSVVRTTAPSHNFGRCELLPILSNAQAVSRYVGSYVTKEAENRSFEDKGMRTVRYALDVRPWSNQYNFVSGGHALWRKGCTAISALYGVSDLSIFGKQWAFHLRDAVFLASDNFSESLAFASSLATMPLQARLMPVARFLISLRPNVSPSLPKAWICAPAHHQQTQRVKIPHQRGVAA